MFLLFQSNQISLINIIIMKSKVMFLIFCRIFKSLMLQRYSIVAQYIHFFLFICFIRSILIILIFHNLIMMMLFALIIYSLFLFFIFTSDWFSIKHYVNYFSLCWLNIRLFLHWIPVFLLLNVLWNYHWIIAHLFKCIII